MASWHRSLASLVSWHRSSMNLFGLIYANVLILSNAVLFSRHLSLAFYSMQMY
jgi:hypothetical protein